MEERDAIDGIRERLAELYPDLDTSGLAVTGRILRLAGRLESLRAAHLEPFGLAPGDFDVLATIRRTERQNGVNPGELIRSVMISSGGMTKRLDRLEQAGLIARQRDPADRRGVLVRLTAQGRQLIDRALPSLLTAERDLVTRHLSATLHRQVESGLRRLAGLETDEDH